MITDLLKIDLSKELGLDKLPEEKRKALLAKMERTLNDRISSAIVMELSEEARNKLAEIPDEEIEGFLSEQIPNLDILVAEVVAEFKKEMLELKTAVDTAKAGK